MTAPTLVTGGCGFVGRHVVTHLIQSGRSVWIVDDLSTGLDPGGWLPKEKVKLEHGSRCVEYRLENVSVTFVNADVRRFFREQPSGGESELCGHHMTPSFGDVIHLSSIVGGRAVINGDPLAVAQDLAIEADLFVWARRTRPERTLYVSSSAAYPIDLQGRDGAVALSEEMIDFGGRLGQPDMTYGWSKLSGEYLARIAASHYGLHVACVRPFSGYGEDQDDTYPVTAIAGRAAKREDPLIVWGSGDQGRDFIHIDDCVDAMFRALDAIDDGSAVNLGSGKLTTFKQVAGMFARLAGYKPEIKGLIDKPTGVHSRYANMDRAHRVLDWKPKISLEEGLKRVFEAVAGKTSHEHAHPDRED